MAAKKKAPKRTIDSRGRVNVGEVENLRDELLPKPGTEDPDEPRMPFKTAYILTREQEDKLCDVALKRVNQLGDQLGRTGDEGTIGGRTSRSKIIEIQNPDSFFGKRKKYTRSFYAHLDFRKKKNTIFEKSNLVATLSQRITMQMIARTSRFFFGQPDDIDWFSTQAVGEEDDQKAEKIKRHSRWKVDQCGIKPQLIDAVEYAFIRGEAIVKPTHQQIFQIYKRNATVLMGGPGEDGKTNVDAPLLDAHGDYIVQGDVFVPEMAAQSQEPQQYQTGPEPGAATGELAQTTQPMLDQAQPQAPQMFPTGKQVLKRDGVTQLPEVPIWKEQVITRQLITFEGPEAPVVYFEDFLCPESATSVQKADLVAHLYDKTIMQVAAMFRGNFGEGDEAIANIQQAVERIRSMTNESNLPKSAASQPRADMKETDTAGPENVPICQFAECHMTYDADGDGIQEEIMLVLDRRSGAPIYYEYEANVTVRGLRPFYVIRSMPVDQRWYGMGSMELFDPEQEFIDLQINRHNFSRSRAGRIDFWNPNATIEGSRDPNLVLNLGKTYMMREGKKKEDIYDFVQVPFDGENLDYLINLFMQMMQLKSGVVNSGDQQMSGLPASDLATGINEIRDSGDELFSRILSHMFPGMKEVLKAIVDIIYANMNRTEIFTFFNGQADEILTLTPDDVRDLALNVTFELSHTQQRKAVETGQVAQELITWYYGLPAELQARLALYARKQLKAFGVSQADKIIEPMTPQAPAAPIDKGSSKANALAAMMKAGAPITVEDINAALAELKFPPLSQEHPLAVATAPPPPKLLPPPGSEGPPKPVAAAV